MLDQSVGPSGRGGEVGHSSCRPAPQPRSAGRPACRAVSVVRRPPAEPARDEPPVRVAPQQPVARRHRMTSLGDRSKPTHRRARKPCSEEWTKLVHERSVPPSFADDKDAPGPPPIALRRRPRVAGESQIQRRDLPVKPSKRRTNVVEPVPDLDNDRLTTLAPQERDVDGPRPDRPVIECQLWQGGPSPAAGDVDKGALPADVLDVARPISARRVFQEGNRDSPAAAARTHQVSRPTADPAPRSISLTRAWESPPRIAS